MRKILLALVLSMLVAVSWAAPVKNMAVCRIQPKGDTLHCFVSGDEFFHRLHDAAGFTIVQNIETGEYVYATVSDGLLQPTQWVPGKDDPAAAGLVPNLKPDAKELARLHKLWEVPESLRPATPKTSGSNHGTLNNIVIFLRFSDETSCTSIPFSTVNGMFNDSASGAVSMYNYFKATSYNKIHVPTHFYPAPSGSTIMSYQDSHPRSYYMPYSATNLSGYVDDDDRRIREFSLLQNAVNWVNTNSPVPSSVNLDMDNDGYVDNICFVASGSFTGWSDLLWPHKWSLYDRTVTINGKQVWTFNFQLAGSGDHYFSVSTFCHEMTHTLGCPDLYHYENYDNITAAGSWDLMEQNQTPPQQTNVFFKLAYLNWFDSIPEITDSGTYTLHSNLSGPNTAYAIQSSNPNQWYILEYRNTSDTFDSSIPGRGLLVWRYNSSPDANNQNFDNSSTPHQLWLFRPGSSDDTTNGNPAQAAFGTGVRTTFNALSDPHPYLSNGTPDTSFSLTNIHLNSDNSAVIFTYSPHGREVCAPLSEFPHTQGFEDGTIGCWEFQSMNTANAGRAGVVDNSETMPHSGNCSFVFSSYSSASNYHQYLISPKLQAANPLHLKFYYKAYQYGSEDFSVRYSTTGKAPSDFTQTICAQHVTNTSYQCCDVLIPYGAKYVAIDYSSDYQYYLYVDDITLRDTLQSDMVHDTTYITIHDTLSRTVFDTLTTFIHDTLTRYEYDTIYHYVSDTVYFTQHDTITYEVYDTVPVTHSYAEISLMSNDTDKGYTAGGGSYPVGTMLEMTALPRRGYQFDMWSDGATENPHTIQVEHDMLYIAFFSRPDAAKTTIYVHDTIYLRDTIWITTHDTVWLTAHDTIWTTIHGTFHTTIHDTIFIPNGFDTVYIPVAIPWELDTTTYHTITLYTDNPSQGFVGGRGTFPYGTVVQFGAAALDGYIFVRWSDDVVSNPRTLTLTEDVSLTAFFDVYHEEPPQSISDVDASAFLIYAQGNRIAVEQSGSLPVVIFNTLGQPVCRLAATQSKVLSQPLRPGLYLVRVGNAPAQKVAIIEN